ncbi:MAG: chorismate synthase [Anaerolineales bacterium]|jgi:chorismate synthase
MSIRFLTSGESHGPGMVAILEGLPAGLELSLKKINSDLARRQKGFGAGPRMKIETDRVEIIGGYMEGKTTGGPISFLIKNRDHEKWKGEEIPPFTAPRPGHADLTGVIKYDFNDLRPALERASARETAARVAAGSICKQFLELFDIQAGGYVISIGDINAEVENIPLQERISLAEESPVRCPDQIISNQMEARIRSIMKEKDTLGGVIEVIALGVPPGLGSYIQWDHRLDARLCAAVMSVQAIKGCEIGPAFENTRFPGTKVHDPINLKGKVLQRPSNRAGGIEGGISNGMPIVLHAAMKPIATTLKPQRTVDLFEGNEVDTRYERSDFCPVPRAVPIIEAMVVITIAEALLEKLGGDNITEIQDRFSRMKKNCLDDISVDGKGHVFWPASNPEDE